MTDEPFWNAFLSRQFDESCRALSQIIRFQTVSGDSEPKAYQFWQSKIAEGFAFLNDIARGMGFVTRQHGDRVLVIEMPGPSSAPVLGFPIHLDVVPAGEGWTRHPFGGEISNGAIWGRGAQDDKGPIIQVLYGLLGAFEFSREAMRTFRKTVRIIIVSEEECGIWDDVPFYFGKEKPPDFSIVPDAYFPITNGEKGILNLDLNFEWIPALEGEFSIIAGERPNVVPAKALLRLSENLLKGFTGIEHLSPECPGAPTPPSISRIPFDTCQATYFGTGAHGSTPQKGHNAAVDALNAAAKIPAARLSAAGRVMTWLASAGASLDGSFLGIDRTHEKVGATTVNLGVLKVTPTSATATLNIRNPIGITCEEIKDLVTDAVAFLGEETSGLYKLEVSLPPGHREPIYIDPAQFKQWIDPMKAAYTQVTKREASLQSIGGTTFAKAFPNAVCFGPVDPAEEPELAHQADERVTLKAMRRNIEIYGRTIVGIAL